jgi:hypothetical protein
VVEGEHGVGLSDHGNQRIAEIIYEKYGEGKSVGALE